MAKTIAESVRATSADLSLRDVLKQPVTELLGVGPEAATALKAISVETIFDLGSSAVFAQAAAAVAAATARLGLLPTDVLDTTGQAAAIADLAGLPLERLRGVSPTVGTSLAAALDAPTLRDFALWPPRLVAHQLVSVAAGSAVPDALDEPAEALRPTLGEYPTERVYYDTLIMLGSTPPANQTPLDDPLSLDALAVPGGVAFGKPAIGALATYSQSWFAQGVTLGHMVHSLALAPGEATRIAVIDWARRTTATATESIDEREQLDNATDHARAASEVQNAVANELQSGGSIATGWAKSTSSGDNLSGSIGGGIAGTIGDAAGVVGFGFGGSTSSQESETNSRATSSSWSVGTKSVIAGMSQKINDRTEQHATSVRNRRATAVREVSQSEHEQVSTRIVANYNHMHALTIQYYEVVQLYRVAVRLNTFVRTLFLPFALLDFSAANAGDVISRFRGQLLAGALTFRARQLLLDDRGRVEVRTAIRMAHPLTIGVLSDANLTLATARMATTARMAPGAGASGAGHAGATIVVDPVHGDGDGGGSGDGGAGASPTPLQRFIVTRPGPVAEILPGDATLVSIAFEDVGIDRVRVDQPGVTAEASTFVVTAATDEVDLTTPIPLRSIGSIQVGRDSSPETEGSMVLHYDSDGHRSMAVVPLSLGSGTAMQKVAFVTGDAEDRRAELIAHLQANRSYYTQAVLSRLDAASLALLLAGVSWQGRPLADQIEPTPVAVTGNYLVLRAPAEDDEPSGLGNDSWGALKAARGVDFESQNPRLVPIPTGGVFAEAVLGRSNSAEKLDITRFWNWQDSPIPLQPPEIAPVSTGTRATPEDLAAGQLGAPVVNVMPPTTLPEPAGVSAVLGALAAGNMFRDMSGLAGTQAAAQAAAEGTLSAATEAGRINGANYQAATTQATEMGKAAADMFKALQTSGGGSGGSGKAGSGGGSGGPGSGGISGDGARVNLGRDLDDRGVSGSSKSAPGGAGTTGAGGGTSGGGSGGGGQVGSDGGFSRERAYSDMTSGYSPDMVDATRSALGDAPPLPGSIDDTGIFAGLGQSGPMTFMEEVLLSEFRRDAEAGGASLAGIKLVPMRLHADGAAFAAKPVELLAWANSPTRFYVNIPKLVAEYDEVNRSGFPPDDAHNLIRAQAEVTIRHAIHLARQFANNQDKPPTDFKQMVAFQHEAYGDDATWLGLPTTKTHLEDDIGAGGEYASDALDVMTKHRDWFNDHLGLSPADAKTAMVNAGYLPREIRGTADYDIADLYVTGEP